MPSIRRRAAHVRTVTPAGFAQLRNGFDGNWQRFNVSNIASRRREGATDCHPADLAACEAAYWSVRDDLLALADDPADVWAYRRFERGRN